MKLIVGLGNPGKDYFHNRHNVGFRCLDYLAKYYAIPLEQRRYRCRWGSGKIADTEVLLAKPQTFVNLSGEAVSKLIRRYHIDLSDLLVISDDLNLPLGKLRIRPRGDAGGHKGLESIISALGSSDFPRLRIGIGRPADSGPDNDEVIVSYVLGDFIPDEEEKIALVIPQTAEVVYCLLTEGIVTAMNKFN